MRAKRAEKIEPEHKQVAVHANRLLAKGEHRRNLVSKTAIHFPRYSERQVRRILKAAGLLEAG